MNTTFEPESLTTGTRGYIPTRAGINLTHLAALLCAITLGAGLTGCSFLKPAKSTARYFVLTPLPAGSSATTASGSIAVGVGPVKLPTYLFNTSLAIRKGTNEIDYLPSALWAERLDTGFQRVLAANLAIVLPTGQVRLSAWKSEEVAAEAYVAIEQFDVDTAGRGVLVARWRILSPGGDKVLKVGTSRLSCQGPLPEAGASAAVTSLSELLGAFSRELAKSLQEATSGQAPPVSK